MGRIGWADLRSGRVERTAFQPARRTSARSADSRPSARLTRGASLRSGCSVAAGKVIDKTLSIIDLKGFTLSIFDAKTRLYLRTIIGLSSDNYPEMLGKMFVINVRAIPRGPFIAVLDVPRRTEPSSAARDRKSVV